MRSRRLVIHTIILSVVVFAVIAHFPAKLSACGGFFCQTSPVDQNAERIIFVDNADGTITAIIQINFTGFAPDFSWILPLPSPIAADDISVPEGAADAFTELELATNPRFIPPSLPECAVMAMEDAMPAEAAGEGVEIFATGEVGPFAYDVIGSEDPTALITWLRDNDYRVEEQMEPLINVYVAEQFVFLAMRLLPDQGAQDIEPVAVTYATEKPMIPLRLTAVAANPDMAVLTWFFADAQAVPENYMHLELEDRDITFFTFGGNNYRALLGERVDDTGGRAFVTEYAQPTDNIEFANPLLAQLAGSKPYLTRLNTLISPEEMTVDPVFRFDPARPDVSNVHDLSEMTGLYDCEKEAAGLSISLPFIPGFGESTDESAETGGSTISLPFITSSGEQVTQEITPAFWIVAGMCLVCGALLLLLAGVVIGKRLL